VEGPDGVILSLVWFQRFDRSSISLGKPLFAFDIEKLPFARHSL
jgi:hypothetical protein